MRTSLVVALAVVPSVASAADPTIPFTKTTLRNGLEVILSEDHRLPLVAVNLWYHVGPVNEPAHRSGFAHLFEHMMFQGSKHVPDDQHFPMLQKAGATLINGTTDFDRTNYFETVPASRLELALWLESDRMGFLLDTMTQDKLDNQRDVVRNERRQSIENVPYGMSEERSCQLMYPEGHPYHGYVIGSHEDLAAATLDDVKAFFRQFYAPSNATLAIVGDFDPARARALVDQYFGPIPSGAPVPPAGAVAPPLSAEKRARVEDHVQLPRVYLGYLLPPAFSPGTAEMEMAGVILGGGKPSRLYKRLVYEQRIAQDVAVQFFPLKLGSYFHIAVTAKPGHTADEMEKAVDAELASFTTIGPTEEEVARARNQIESGIVFGLQSLGGFGGKADRLQTYNQYLGDPGGLAQDLARYRAATATSIKEAAARTLTDKRVVVQTVPVQEPAPQSKSSDSTPSPSPKPSTSGK